MAAALCGALVGGAVSAAPVGAASQPSRPKAGLGSKGPCGQAASSVANPRHAAGETGLAVWVFQPTGAGTAPLTGGRCGDKRRPAVFLAHGFGATDPANYAALIGHLVSVGNVVVYATYTANDGNRSTLEEATRIVDAGNLAAVARSPRIDRSRVGFWGHSNGAGMVPYLVQRSAARGWGGRSLWMSVVAQAYSQLIGTGDVRVPAHTQEMTVAFEHDEMADNRLGIDIFTSLTLLASHKRYVLVQTDPYGQPAFAAEHNAPASGNADADAVDFLLWRYADLLESCALSGRHCTGDLPSAGNWSDGTPVVGGQVSTRPVDTGPYPAALAECDAIYGPSLNTRIARCGPTHL